LRWFLSNQWIIVIFDKNLKRNITHSLNLWDLFSMIRIWSVDFNAKWLMMTMKNSSSKYCDNFVKAQTNVVVFNFVTQFLDSTSIRFLKWKRLKRFTSFFLIWWKTISKFRFLFSSTYKMKSFEKFEKILMIVWQNYFFNSFHAFIQILKDLIFLEFFWYSDFIKFKFDCSR
jgi:hypothetical protein